MSSGSVPSAGSVTATSAHQHQLTTAATAAANHKQQQQPAVAQVSE